MKKIIAFIFSLFIIISLSSCGGSSSSNKEETSDEKIILNLVNEYDSTNTKGFDYELSQYLNNSIVNSHKITLRIDNDSETIGLRVEYQKNLNDDITKEQFTETTVTTYYKNNKVAVYENNSWNWKNCSFDEFSKSNIKDFNFDISKLSNVNLDSSGKYNILTFGIDDSNTKSFLGVSSSVKDLKFEIKTDSDKKQLISLDMNYSQDLTTTKISFIPYYGSVNVSLPQ